MEDQKKIDKIRKSALSRFIESQNKINLAIANFRTDQRGFKEELKAEILADIRRLSNEKDKLDPPNRP